MGDEDDNDRYIDDHIKKIMIDIGLTIKDNMNPLIKSTHYAKAKYAMIEPSFIRSIDIVKQYDNRLSEVLEDIHDIHNNLFKRMIDIIFNIESINNKQHNNYRDRTMKAYNDATNTTDAADRLYRENQDIISKWEDDKQLWNVEKSRLMNDISSLETENKKYLDMILKRTKNKVDEVVENSNMHAHNNNNNGISEQDMKNIEKGHHLTDINVRVLSLKQMNEVINDIYESKLKCDQKYIDNKLPRETMEQHMYTYLNTKYGLKTIIIEWATAIVNGIKQYNTIDNNISVFGKILRNECDEEFRFVQSQVKTTINELLKMLIKSKYPYKNKQEINDLLNTKCDGYLSEDEVHEIIKYMYSKDDSNIILSNIKQHLTRGAHLSKDRRLTREERIQISKEQEKKRIQFNIFQKVG